MNYAEDCFHLGAKALIHNNEGKLLLLQKNTKKPQALKSPNWDLPGGRIQRNESLEKALKREVYEETGLQLIQMVPFVMVLTNARISLPTTDVGLILAVYLCDILDNAPSIHLSQEHIHYDWAESLVAAELLAPNHPAELVEKIAKLCSHRRGSCEISKV